MGAVGRRAASLLDTVKTSFGFPTAVAIVIGLAAGFGLPALDAVLIVNIPVFEFDTQDAARGLLQTVATVTVSVAGLAFSVTVVAFALASTQLSPRVLRSFRSDRLVQVTLATFIGSFIYCLAVLVRLGAVGGGGIPNLSITFAVVLAIASFGLFAAFIAHIVVMLQPSSVIEAIRQDADKAIERRYPSGIGGEPENRDAEREVAASSVSAAPVRAHVQGYLTFVGGEMIVREAAEHDALVRQRATVGDYVLPGEVIAEIESDDPAELADAVRDAFGLERQRTFAQDSAFGVRQLADIALKGLSPGINDPTTARNAMEAMTGILIRFAHSEAPFLVRADDAGVPRFVARTPDLDDLVGIGFTEVAGFASSHPSLAVRLTELLEHLSAVAAKEGLPSGEAARLIAEVRSA